MPEILVQEFPDLSEKTRSIITLTFSMLVRPLVTRPLRKLFSADTNIKPEDAFDGKIIIVDLPVQEFRLVGQDCQPGLEILLSGRRLATDAAHRHRTHICARFFCGRTRRRISSPILTPNIRPSPAPQADAPCI